MSEFMKIVSNLGQNFRACLPAIAGREACAVLEKPVGLPSRRLGKDSPGTWLPADTKRSCQELTLGGWGESQREALSSVKTAHFLCRKALASNALQS